MHSDLFCHVESKLNGPATQLFTAATNTGVGADRKDRAVFFETCGVF